MAARPVPWILPALLGVGGLGCGLALMTWALRRAARGHSHRLLAALQHARPVQGFLAGVLLTVLLQSSSTFGILLVGLVNAGWVNLPVARAAIVGANIGTTVTAHLTATPSLQLGWTLVAAGLVLAGAARSSSRWRAVGLAGVGLGAALTSLDLLGRTLQALPGLTSPAGGPWWALNRRPWLAFVTGLLAAASALSSGAVVALLQRVVAVGLLDVQGALPVLYGANVGTTSDVLVASLLLGGPGVNVALFHVAINAAAAGVAAAGSPLLAAAARCLGTDPARQVAWAHTLFNLLAAFLAWPWTAEPRRPRTR